MTDAQIFQLIGIAYLVIGFGILTSRDFYNKVITGFLDSPVAYYLGGIVALIAGFLLITFHNIWVKDWPVIITIIGWIAFIKGILLLGFPQAADRMTRSFIRMKNFLNVWAIIAIIIGILCCYLGFFVLQQKPAM